MDSKPKLELKISKKKLASLELIKQRAAMRTNRRIQMQLDEEELKKREREMVANIPEEEFVNDGEAVDTTPLNDEPVKASKKG